MTKCPYAAFILTNLCTYQSSLNSGAVAGWPGVFNTFARSLLNFIFTDPVPIDGRDEDMRCILCPSLYIRECIYKLTFSRCFRRYRCTSSAEVLIRPHLTQHYRLTLDTCLVECLDLRSLLFYLSLFVAESSSTFISASLL